ncbi:unnamed protein product [Rodentolepis nana]|uniref:UDENN domain-containing protein n=1 Tax=Rodentolepis nana TaxID=102285 RepID=A0A0R3T4R3_RODNA|nr:unnamed protein product [Rodentolepis nana]
MDEKQIPLDRFSQWLYAICIVNFDDDVGQTIESIYPRNTELSNSERSTISYLAFPDSHSSGLESNHYHFRFKCSSINRLILRYCTFLYNDYSPPFLPVYGMCFGYVCFRQEKDLSQKRHYSQKSVVVLSALPFDELFYEVAKVISDSYFSSGFAAIEEACQEIDSWPPPRSNEFLTVPLLGTFFNLRIPSVVGTASLSTRFPLVDNGLNSSKDSSSVSSLSTISLPTHAGTCTNGVDQKTESEPSTSNAQLSVHSSNSCIFVPNNDSLSKIPRKLEITLESRNYAQAFAPILPHLQRIWELVITAQPILVMAPNPGKASQTVQALVSCITPLAFSSDYRPFFNIYDSEFKDVTRGASSSPISVLGVTNPFFSKALQNWPNVIRLGKVKCVEKKKKSHQLTSKKLLDDLKPGLYSRCKPFLKKDAGFFKRLKKSLTDGTPEEAISLAIHRFFQELTMSFLIPLEHYLSMLMPLHRDISPFRSVPVLKRFNMNDFFQTLESAGPRLTCDVKGDWVGLYR